MKTFKKVLLAGVIAASFSGVASAAGNSHWVTDTVFGSLDKFGAASSTNLDGVAAIIGKYETVTLAYEDQLITIGDLHTDFEGIVGSAFQGGSVFTDLESFEAFEQNGATLAKLNEIKASVATLHGIRATEVDEESVVDDLFAAGNGIMTLAVDGKVAEFGLGVEAIAAQAEIVANNIASDIVAGRDVVDSESIAIDTALADVTAKAGLLAPFDSIQEILDGASRADSDVAFVAVTHSFDNLTNEYSAVVDKGTNNLAALSVFDSSDSANVNTTFSGYTFVSVPASEVLLAPTPSITAR